MTKIVVMFILVFAALQVGACSRNESETLTNKKGTPAFHGVNDTSAGSSQGFVAIIKGATLADYRTATIGKATDDYRYFTRREWSETRSENGKVYVDFSGWFDGKRVINGLAADGVEVKFVIEPTGEFYVAMVSGLQGNAGAGITRHPLAQIKPVLESIYSNKPITL
ncbi:hypothetical protein [Geobacter sp. DSM 9736]|uniref:hypothetical protein n=1 Tax=Geobacter sp. DSM 9736 TaxID=1277350 RepID=UPI000B502AFE|nr:hypothetical protein [Geobacter sp. DSM 9736]